MSKISESFNNTVLSAHLDISADSELASQLEKDIQEIMDYVEGLRQVNTTNESPLIHPLAEHQVLRTDEAEHLNHIEELKKVTEHFVDDFYRVPNTRITGE